MIQRVQSVFILAAVILAVFLFFIPLVTFDLVDNRLIFNASGYQNESLWYFIAFTAINIMIMIVQFFMYRNRKKQIFIGKIAIYMWVLWILLFSLFIYLNYKPGLVQNYTIHFGAIFPVLIICCIVLANRRIQKDEDLVRSIDRIR